EQEGQSGFYPVPLPVFSIPVRYLQVKVGLPESLYRDYRITSSLYKSPQTVDTENITSQGPFHQQAYECTLLEPEDSAWLHVGILARPPASKITLNNTLDDGIPSRSLPSQSGDLLALAPTPENGLRKEQACQTESEQLARSENVQSLHLSHAVGDLQQLQRRLRRVRVQRNALLVLLVAMILGWYLAAAPLSDHQDWYATVHTFWTKWRPTSVSWVDHPMEPKENASKTTGQMTPNTAVSSPITTDQIGEVVFHDKESTRSSDIQVPRTLTKDEREASVSVTAAEVESELSNVIGDSTADQNGATAPQVGMDSLYLDSLHYFIHKTSDTCYAYFRKWWNIIDDLRHYPPN
ncbi:hypothetical protein IWQ62_006366, partial [Dispira parvispora]